MSTHQVDVFLVIPPHRLRFIPTLVHLAVHDLNHFVGILHLRDLLVAFCDVVVVTERKHAVVLVAPRQSVEQSDPRERLEMLANDNVQRNSEISHDVLVVPVFFRDGIVVEKILPGFLHQIRATVKRKLFVCGICPEELIGERPSVNDALWFTVALGKLGPFDFLEWRVHFVEPFPFRRAQVSRLEKSSGRLDTAYRSSCVACTLREYEGDTLAFFLVLQLRAHGILVEVIHVGIFRVGRRGSTRSHGLSYEGKSYISELSAGVKWVDSAASPGVDPTPPRRVAACTIAAHVSSNIEYRLLPAKLHELPSYIHCFLCFMYIGCTI